MYSSTLAASLWRKLYFYHIYMKNKVDFMIINLIVFYQSSQKNYFLPEEFMRSDLE